MGCFGIGCLTGLGAPSGGRKGAFVLAIARTASMEGPDAAWPMVMIGWVS